MRVDGFYLRNDLRRRSLDEVYNPLTGEGCCGERVVVKRWRKRFHIPAAMCADTEYAGLKVDSPEWRRLRCRYDFEYWCATCAYIKPKSGGRPVLCVLNEGQRSVVEALESDRMACRPSRAVVLKARQWGCSTVIQLYIAWLQTCVYQGANAVICAHLKNTAAMIRGMYSRLLSRYPEEMVCGSEKPKLRNFEGSTEIKTISGRECTVMIGSCINPDAIRGSDISLAHLTEVAYWRNTASVSPEDVAQAVYGTVSFEKGTLVVLESTASGVGNFFHREWLGAKANCCAHAVFVPWNELSVNSREVEDARSVFETMDEEERALFDGGMCIEQVYWRRCKRQEMVNAERFNAEFPLHDTDAFASNDMNVFDALHVEELRRGCSVPAERGGIYGLNFVPAPNGRLSVWRRPEAGRTYVASVDVGGRSASADWSVVAVLRAGEGDELPEVVAQWRGHTDHDILARKAVEIARYYNEALLVVESNTLESSGDGSGAYVLEEMARCYPNMYLRRSVGTVDGRVTKKYGFHTNRQTKPMLIGNLIAAVRTGSYVERDDEACNELICYRRLPGGGYGAEAPKHDDIVMTRAMALYILATEYASDACVDMPVQESW